MHKIHVCFFIDSLSSFISKFSSFKYLLDRLLNDNNFKVSILKESNNISNTFNNFLNNLPSNVKIYTYHINNFNLDLARLDIDYIFTYNPYFQSYMNWNNWSNKIKICYIEYGTTFITENISKREYISGDSIPLMKQAYKIFYENDFMFENILKFNPGINKEKLIVAGKPKYDYIFKNKSDIRHDLWRLDRSKNSKIKRIIWSPHWSFVPTWINSIPHSQFLKYYKLWLEIPKKYPDLDIIMKPHPSLFSNLEKLENLGWNGKKVAEWKKEFLNNPNAQIMENGFYDDLFLTSDAMINDSVSFIVEYLPTLKPLLLCRNGYGKDGYSEYGENIAKAHYNAYNENDIINFIENVVIGENDTMLNERKKALKENIFIPDGGSGLFIKNYLKNDYEENSSKKINLKEIFRNKYNTMR